MPVKYRLSIFLFFIVSSLTVSSQQVFNADSAYALSERLNKPILMIFSGSDWCPACIRLQKKVLSDNTFKEFMDKNLVLLIVDFPQRKMPDKIDALQNEKLAELYNTNSTFPKLLIFAPGKSSQTEIFYVNQNASEFIAKVKEIISLYPE